MLTLSALGAASETASERADLAAKGRAA